MRAWWPPVCEAGLLSAISLAVVRVPFDNNYVEVSSAPVKPWYTWRLVAGLESASTSSASAFLEQVLQVPGMRTMLTAAA